MATYTAEELRGQGTLTEAISGATSFELTNPSSGSAYFTFETVRNNDGYYDENSPTNAVGNYVLSSTNIQSLVTSSYIFSVSVSPGGPYTFDFTPTTSITQNSGFLRATGDISLTIS